MYQVDDTIVAIATPQGQGAIGVVRLSGNKSITIANQLFQGKNLQQQSSHTIHFGSIKHEGKLIDEVVVSLYKNPKSYTGEDVVEISCHGSSYILQEVLQLCSRLGARLAQPGEFTLRAFLHGKMDLASAEAVQDLISSESEASHEIAIQQMRGGFSQEIKHLRKQLVRFSALTELELDFSEEDVEFADRAQFLTLLEKIETVVKSLLDSFAYGNAIKEGIPVAIIGKPNAGKSSLLNALLNEDRAIVSDIAGTTRDTIEDTMIIRGITFRFIDTAGIRHTQDHVEAIGVQKAKEKAAQAKILLYLFDRNDSTAQEVIDHIKELHRNGLTIIIVENKIDLQGGFFEDEFTQHIYQELIPTFSSTYQAISAHHAHDIDALKQTLLDAVETLNEGSSTIISNSRHRIALEHTLQSMNDIREGIHAKISGDLLAMDIREALRHLGAITGEIDIDKDILGTIFGEFCIGK